MNDILQEIEAAERMVVIAHSELNRCAADVEFLGWPRVEYVVEWTTRGHTAGWCMYPHRERGLRIKFNAFLAQQEGERFKEIVAHEYAHAVCWMKYGPKVHHGWEWRQLMHIFGYRGDRCHQYATMSAQTMRRKGI